VSKFHTTVVFNNYVIIGEVHTQLILAGLQKIIIQATQEAMELVRVDTTTLQKSIGYRKIEQGVYELFATAEYAVYQEFGTSKFYGQPYLFPATVNAGAKIQTMIGAVLAQGV